jgi:hypothetical protein
MKGIQMEHKMKELIIHFRQHVERVTEEGGKKELNFVLKNNGGYTVLVKKIGDQYMMATARCGKKDNFNKAIGTAIVRGRSSCQRRPLLKQFPTLNLALFELKRLTHKCKETYSPEFLELLLKKLV